MTVVFLFPMYWLATLSFQDGITASTLPPKFLFWPTLDNYTALFQGSDFGRVIMNTIVIAVGSTALALALGTPAAYALARFRIAWDDQISFNILSVRLMPSYVAVVPLFLVLQTLNLFGSIAGVVVALSLVGASFIIWMMRPFFASIPLEIEQAALIDGSSRLGALWRIVLPLAAPGLVVASIFTAINAWNEFVLVLILGGEAAKTMPLALGALVTNQRAEWGQLAAGSVLTMLPVLLFALLIRRYFLAGVTTGGVQG